MASETKKSWIPEVSKERILELATRIKPVARMAKTSSSSEWEGNTLYIKEWTDPKGKWSLRRQDQEGHLYYLKPLNPFTFSYTWKAVPTTRATRLVAITDVRMYHTYAFYGFFKPTVSEVLAQIPEKYIDRVVAFEIVEKPEEAGDLNKELEATDAGYHVSKVRLYERA